MTSINKPNRIAVLDDLRGIAILTVICYHYLFVFFLQQQTNSSFYEFSTFCTNYFNFGAYGVSLFFLVSGFVIPMSLKGESRFNAVKYFFIRRFFRLYPTYWFSIILIVGAVWLFQNSSNYTLKQILINFTMLQDIFKTPHIDGVFWTLMIELKFYILTAILFYFGLLKKIQYIILFLFLASSITLFTSYYLNKGFGNTIIAYLMLMYLGSAFYCAYQKTLNKKILLFLIVMVALYFLSNHFFLTDSKYGYALGYSTATLAAIMTFSVAINLKNQISSFTTFYGNISYSLYLIHQVIGYLIIHALFDSLFSQLLALIIMTLVSYVMHLYIENPSNHFGHKYAKSN